MVAVHSSAEVIDDEQRHAGEGVEAALLASNWLWVVNSTS